MLVTDVDDKFEMLVTDFEDNLRPATHIKVAKIIILPPKCFNNHHHKTTYIILSPTLLSPNIDTKFLTEVNTNKSRTGMTTQPSQSPAKGITGVAKITG